MEVEILHRNFRIFIFNIYNLTVNAHKVVIAHLQEIFPHKLLAACSCSPPTVHRKAEKHT